MLALRTSFVALLFEADDPIVNRVRHWIGGADETLGVAATKRGDWLWMTCWVRSPTTDDFFKDNYTMEWQFSQDEGGTWVDVFGEDSDDPSVEALDVNGNQMTLNSDNSAPAGTKWDRIFWGWFTGQWSVHEGLYSDYAFLRIYNYQDTDAGLYRLKLTGAGEGYTDPAYSESFLRAVTESG